MPIRLTEADRHLLSLGPSRGMQAAIAGFMQHRAADERKREVRMSVRKVSNILEYMDAQIAAGVPADVSRPLTFKDREFWRPVYAAMEDPVFVAQTSAQVGKTIMLLHGIAARGIRSAFAGRPMWHGLYLPTQEMVRTFSASRLDPILLAHSQNSGVPIGSNPPSDYDRAVAGMDEEQKLVTRNSFNFKSIGRGFAYLAWVRGTLVDALPLDVMWADEVRLMDPALVDRIEKRVMGSSIGHLGFTSTAGMPGDAISVRYEQSDQQRFHHDCKCPDGVDLAKTWPTCLGRRESADDPLDRYYLYCPSCGTEIKERNKGRWIAHNPDSGLYKGFSVHQLMTQQPLVRIVAQWDRADRNTQEFYNSVLGLEYLDPEACPMTDSVIRRCVNPDVMWARPGDVVRTSMGIDQMGGVNYYVISQRTRDGKRRVVHMEINWSPEPFHRAAQLMRDYGVEVCCLEPLPNYNDAQRFANQFPGKVFLVHYANMAEGMLRWNDLIDEAKGEVLVNAELKTRYSVKADQRKLRDAWVDHWREGRTELPNTRALTQRVRTEDGGETLVEICEQVYVDHLQRLAKRWNTERKLADGVHVAEETGRKTYHWVKLARSPSGKPRAPVKGAASDPHFSFADLLDWLAWTRLETGGGEFKIHFI